AIAARREFESVSSPPTAEQLKKIVPIFRGEFLEGLNLPDFDDFQAWCIAEREQCRMLHAKVLSTVIQSLTNDPSQALPHARELVQVDPLSETAHALLIQLLHANGRSKEAAHQYEASLRILKEAGITPSGSLKVAWDAARRIPQTLPNAESAPL